MSQGNTYSRTSGPRVEGAELFRTAAPPGFLCSQWRAGRAPSSVVQFRGQDSSAPRLETAEGKFTRPREQLPRCHLKKNLHATLQNKSLIWWEKMAMFFFTLLSPTHIKMRVTCAQGFGVFVYIFLFPLCSLNRNRQFRPADVSRTGRQALSHVVALVDKQEPLKSSL